jgi:hypothetical protein
MLLLDALHAELDGVSSVRVVAVQVILLFL